MSKVIVSLSGGMDSATLLAKAKDFGHDVSCVGFLYGSKHGPHEGEAALALAAHYGVPFRRIDLTAVLAGFRSNLLASGGDIPEGHYEAPSMALTVVPGRNLIFASVLAGAAWSEGASEVWLGIHAGDHAIYPDCRPDFLRSMRGAVEYGTDGAVTLKAPFLYANKAGILKEGFRLDVPYEKTRTCYKAQPVACGRCGSCQERLMAFREVGRGDPAEYESREILPK